MAYSPDNAYLSPPASAASPAPSTASFATRKPTLPTPRRHRLQAGSQKEIVLINYVDDKILRITRRYAKKFSNEAVDTDDAPGYTTYDQFVADADPLLDVVWVSGTPTIQIAYFLSIAGLACSYMTAFPFSPSVFYITGKVDQGFASLLQASQKPASSAPSPYHVSMTEKVRIKSLIEETRVTAVNAASASGQAASIHDLSDADTEDDEDEGDEDDDDVDRSDSMAVSLGVSKIYRRTLEILGDSLVSDALPPHQEADVPMS